MTCISAFLEDVSSFSSQVQNVAPFALSGQALKVGLGEDIGRFLAKIYGQESRLLEKSYF